MKTLKSVLYAATSFLIASAFTTEDKIFPDYKVSQNDTIKIELPYTAGTGYEWFWDKTGNSIVDSAKVEYIYNSAFVGGSGTQVWYLVAKESGKETLSFTYKRSWETTTEDKHKEYTIKVK